MDRFAWAAELGKWINFGGVHLAVGVGDELPEPAHDAAIRFRILRFVEQDAAQFGAERLQLFRLYKPDVLLAVTLDIGPFEQPGGRPPMLVRSLPQGIERPKLGSQGRAAKSLVELGISLRLAADGVGRTSDVPRGPLDAATSRDERADFATFDFVKGTRPAELFDRDLSLGRGMFESRHVRVEG